MSFKLDKCPENPILTAKEDSDWEKLGVLNPACVYEDGTFWMFYRAAADDEEHTISLGLAKSTDGVHFERCFDHPILSPSKDGPDGNGVEDPRVVKMNGWYYMTYAARSFPTGKYWLPKDQRRDYFYDPAPLDGPRSIVTNDSITYLAISKDMVNWRKLGRMTDSRHDDRDAFIFPEKVNGKYVMLSRSQNRVGEEYGCKVPSIWISYSDDLLEWDNYKLLCTAKEDWEAKKIGGSTPPIKTDKGWLFLYHGVAAKEEGGDYCVGAMLLDLDNPEKILARTKEPIMVPEHSYETEGFYCGCVFPTGAVVVEDTLYVYYGSADKYCCQATCKLSELLNYLVEECGFDK